MCISTYYQDAKDVDGIAETADVACHIQDGINFAFVLNHTIGKSDIYLEVRCRVDSAEVAAICMANRQELEVVRLMLIPNPELRVFQLHFVVV